MIDNESSEEVYRFRDMPKYKQLFYGSAIVIMSAGAIEVGTGLPTYSVPKQAAENIVDFMTMLGGH